MVLKMMFMGLTASSLLFGGLLRAVRSGVSVPVVVVRVHWRWVVQDFHADHFGLGEPVDDHGGGQHQREESQRQGLPRFQRDYGDGDGDQHGGLEFQAQQERDDYFADETAACKKRKRFVKNVYDVLVLGRGACEKHGRRGEING